MSYQEKVEEFREALHKYKNPLFFYDDDPDGLSSFLLLYKYIKEGNGVVVKSSPELKKIFLNKVEEYRPDVIFILDKPMISDEFLEGVNVPVYWVDHHEPQKKQGVHYLNPMVYEDVYKPTSAICYDIVGQNTWIAAIGTIGDWAIPAFLPMFIEQYPGYAAPTSNPSDLLYKQKVGRLVRVFTMLLKGKTSDVKKNISRLMEITHPDELIFPTTKEGLFLKKRIADIEERYDALFQDAKQKVGDDKLFVFTYTEAQWSFTSELSNEIIAHYPEKIVFICRSKGGEMKCSLRSRTIPVRDPLKKALKNIEGHGGGHEFACGVVVKEEDWEQFLVQLREALYGKTEE